MNTLFGYCFYIMGLMIAGSAEYSESILKKDIVWDDYGRGFAEKRISFPNKHLLLTIEVTSKGNGTMQIGDDFLTVYDVHNDGLLYEDELLQLVFYAVGESLFLVVDGHLLFTDEKTDDVAGRQYIGAIYQIKESKAEYLFGNHSFLLYSLPRK